MVVDIIVVRQTRCFCRTFTLSSYSIFVVSGFVAFVVNMVVLLLKVELDPVVKTHNLPAVLGFSNKHMFKSAGIRTVVKIKSLCSDIG